jgi:hypothetical protein
MSWRHAREYCAERIVGEKCRYPRIPGTEVVLKETSWSRTLFDPDENCLRDYANDPYTRRHGKRSQVDSDSLNTNASPVEVQMHGHLREFVLVYEPALSADFDLDTRHFSHCNVETVREIIEFDGGQEDTF